MKSINERKERVNKIINNYDHKYKKKIKKDKKDIKDKKNQT